MAETPAALELPLGLSTGAFWRAPLLGCLQPIRDAGFGQIEIASSPSHLDFHDRSACAAAAARIRELGLGVHSFHAPFTDQIDISALDSRARDTAVREISQAAEAAAILEARFFVLHPGPETTGVPRGERLDRMDCAVEALDRIAWRAGELGVRLVLENMLPHLFAGHVRDLLWLLGALATTNVGICLDTGHAFLSGDLRHVAHKLSGHLWMVHASDNRGQRDDHLPPGEGAIVWPDLLRQLAAAHFDGAFILELAGEGEPAEVLRRARRSADYLRRLGSGG
ncbi:MAG: sugar phosphate isomerase/epimerase [Thermoanaerobaculia bacterium]|nr:sugar phosphate isomerase/epimerase [Thermoanaerobaculia bacterium]